MILPVMIFISHTWHSVTEELTLLLNSLQAIIHSRLSENENLIKGCDNPQLED